MTETWTIETHFTPLDGDEFLVIRSDARPEHVCTIGPLLIEGDKERAQLISKLPALVDALQYEFGPRGKKIYDEIMARK